MSTLSGFKKYFRRSKFLMLMFTMMRGVTSDNTPPVMTVEVTTDKTAYVPGDEATVLVHLKNFTSNDSGYSYLNFIVQYDSSVFNNLEYVNQSIYKDEHFTAGSEVNNIFKFNFMNPVDGSISFGMNTTMRGIDIQVEANNRQTYIPAVDQTLITFKLRIKNETHATSSTISLANEFTRIRTSTAGSSVYLYSPDVEVVPAVPLMIHPSMKAPPFSQGLHCNRLA